jgi:protein involved in polysaccharide export with SLBB domain
MKILNLVVVSLISVTLQAAESNHKLAAGDEIQIQVYEEADLSMHIWLDDTGVFNYPYLGNVVANGLTVRELKSIIHNGLLDGVLVNPSVNISVVKYRNIYVTGGVKSAGGYPYQPGLSVRQAIALAGGLTEFGSASKIKVRREKMDQAEPAGYDIMIGPGDTITVGEGIF